MENLADEILQTTKQDVSKEDLISGLNVMIETAKRESLTKNLPFDQEPERPLSPTSPIRANDEPQPPMRMTFRSERSTVRPVSGTTPQSPSPEQRRRRAPRSPPSRTSSSSQDRRPHILPISYPKQELNGSQERTEDGNAQDSVNKRIRMAKTLWLLTTLMIQKCWTRMRMREKETETKIRQH